MSARLLVSASYFLQRIQTFDKIDRPEIVSIEDNGLLHVPLDQTQSAKHRTGT